MINLKRILPIFLLLSGTASLHAQPGFSVTTDVGIQRNFKEGQQFFAFGQTVQAQFHITKKDAVYFWVAYYSNGKFSNQVKATAKLPTTNPQEITYRNKAKMQFEHFSTGYKKYFKGSYDIESGWNLYGYAGFGIIFGRVENTQSANIDTALYINPVKPGEGDFKRLTLDLGMGWEIPLGGDFYFYTEGRTWIPTSDYPSKYLFVNDNAPLVAMINAGIRILF